MVVLYYVYFFFSSRRRHTRLVSDWSSDVCSSDLADQHLAANPRPEQVWQFGETLERRGEIAHDIRQRHPKLHPMQHRRLVRLGDLTVHDAVTGGHDVELARPYRRAGTAPVAMLDLA